METKEFIRRAFRLYWLRTLLLALAVICDAAMDYFNFQRPYDSGFWSLHTEDTADAWHWIKKLKWLFVIVAIYGLNWFVVLGGFINLFFHELFYHKIFKRSKKN